MFSLINPELLSYTYSSKPNIANGDYILVSQSTSAPALTKTDTTLYYMTATPSWSDYNSRQICINNGSNSVSSYDRAFLKYFIHSSNNYISSEQYVKYTLSGQLGTLILK